MEPIKLDWSKAVKLSRKAGAELTAALHNAGVYDEASLRKKKGVAAKIAMQHGVKLVELHHYAEDQDLAEVPVLQPDPPAPEEKPAKDAEQPEETIDESKQ